MSPLPGPGRARQETIFRDGVLGRVPAVPTDPAALEHAARKAMSKRAWAYVAGGAGAGATMRANREALERWRIVPRMLRDTTDLPVRTLPWPAPGGDPSGERRRLRTSGERGVRRLAPAP